jgi:hypothetical protein
MPEVDPWQALLDDVDAECRRVGYWGGEARVLRDSIGAKRIGPRNARRIAAALSAAGYESDPPLVQFESQSVVIGRTGASDLTTAIARLLPAIREADRIVPTDAEWRDEVVARAAVRAWDGPTPRG